MKNKITSTIVFAVVVAVILYAHLAPGQYITTNAPVALPYNDGITTSSASVSTGTLSLYDAGITLYADIELGNLTGLVIAPCAASYGDPAASNYFLSADEATTLTASGKYVVRWPRESIRTARYWGCSIQGIGDDNSNSTATISYKRDQGQP